MLRDLRLLPSPRALRAFACAAIGALALGMAALAQASADSKDPSLTCNEQRPLSFLVRGNYAMQDGMRPEERRARAEIQAQALRFRTERYGRYRNSAPLEWNQHPVSDFIEPTTFMGLPVRVNKRIIPALTCVEQAIRKTCGESPYEPLNILGIRGNNTFHNGEMSNHLYGIALDIDPERNPCCRCVEPFPDHPGCRKKNVSAYDRAELPKCWIDTFERYGFYWLGHDKLIDTMHFEFLGDPDRIVQP